MVDIIFQVIDVFSNIVVELYDTSMLLLLLMVGKRLSRFNLQKGF